MASINLGMAPGFVIEIQQGAGLVLPATVYDRAGNVIDLTGYAVKFAAKSTFLQSNGFGQMTSKDVILLDVLATIVDAVNGNITIPIDSAYTGTPKDYPASLRIFNTTTTDRVPDDAYAGTLSIEPAVVRVEE